MCLALCTGITNITRSGLRESSDLSDSRTTSLVYNKCPKPVRWDTARRRPSLWLFVVLIDSTRQLTFFPKTFVSLLWPGLALYIIP